MKKFTIIPLFICLLFSALAGQDWLLISPENQYSYSINDSELIGAGISTDTVIYLSFTARRSFLNTIIKECPTCEPQFDGPSYVRNQEQFMGQYVEEGPDYQKIVYKDGSEKLFRLATPLGEDWVFDPANQTMASITEKQEREIFPGVTDSVATVETSTGEVYEIAKNYGLVQYTAANGEQFTLRGLKNLDLGYNGLRFKAIFDFDPGDVFYYQETNFSGGTFGTYTIYTKTKRTILDKTANDSVFTYTVRDLIKVDYQYIPEDSPPGFSVDTTYELEYQRKNYAKLESYPWVLLTDAFEFQEPGDIVPAWMTARDEQNTEGEIIRVVGSTDPQGFGPGVFNIDYDSEGLDSGWDYRQVYRAGLGETFLYAYAYETTIDRVLAGYVKGQDTVGVVPADSLLLVSAANPRKASPVRLFPNPVANTIYLESFDFKPQDRVEIYDLKGSGQVLVAPVGTQQLDVSNLKPGVHLLLISRAGQSFYAKFVKD